MDVNIKTEDAISELTPQQTQRQEPTVQFNGTNDPYNIKKLDKSSLRPPERETDVPPDVNNSQSDMPVVDLRLVKQENLDDDDGQKKLVDYKDWNMSEPELRVKTKRTLLSTKNADLSSITNEEYAENQRQQKKTESFPYRVPIVYPIRSPPVDFQSKERSPRTKEYRLERETSQSPRQLYEERSTESPRDMETRYEDNSNFTYLSRYSPSQKTSPYSMSPPPESKEDSRTSPKDANPSRSPRDAENADDKKLVTKRRRNMDGLIPLDSEKEEESLWKQVQRYRHRKRLPLGKLMTTQEETIFMQYNEIRERRHREGRVTNTRQLKPQSPGKEHVGSTPESQPENEAKGDVEPRLQRSVSPQLSPSNESVSELPPSFVARQRVVDLAPKQKGVTYVYVTGPGSLPVSSTNPEVHPVIFNSNTKCRNEQTESQTNKANHVYHGYIPADPPRCHGYEPREVEARGRTVVRATPMEYRGFGAYDDCYHDNYHNHRAYCTSARYHSNESCHGSRKRRVHGWDHYCCRRKRIRPTSSDEDEDDYVVNDIPRWYSKERLQTLDARAKEDLLIHETKVGSPGSADSRDNESVENTPGQNNFSMENGENGQLTNEGIPGRKSGENNANILNPSSFPPTEDSVRPKDNDVVCQVNGLFSLPGYRETKYDITKGELMRRTGLPETLTRVEMISYVRQAKTSGRILLDTNGITTSNRSHPTILSRVCEREAQVLACGIHKMNLEYLPIKRLVQTCVEMYKSRGCDGCQDCRLKLRRRLVDIEITRNTLKELHHVIQEGNADGTLDSFELASHNFGTLNLTNHLRLIDEYYKQLLFALDKE